MTWQKKYANKVVTADEAIEMHVGEGCKIYLPGVCGVACDLATAVAHRSEQVDNITIHCANPADSVGFEPVIRACRERRLGITSFFMSPQIRRLVEEGHARFLPQNLSGVPGIYSKEDIHKPNVVLIKVSPPDQLGFFSCGIETGLAVTPARSANILIGQVDENMPYCHSDTLVHESRFHCLVDASGPAITYPKPSACEIVKRISNNVIDFLARNLKGNPTLQIGLGDIPDTILEQMLGGGLGAHRVRIHSELFGNGVMKLWDNGMIDDDIDIPIVAGLVVGSTPELYKWVHLNKSVSLRPTEWVNHPTTISSISNMVAINGAITVDLMGQVNPCSIGHRLYSGSGGQLDVMYGTSLAPNGLPIIAMKSTADIHGELRSSIVSELAPGSGVVTTCYCGIIVATEWGVADLRGKDTVERIYAMIDIAHPDFRDSLYQEARTNRCLM